MTGTPLPFDSAVYDPATMAASSLTTFKVPLYRRPWFLIVLAIIVVVGVSVITDLPNHISNKQDITAQNDVIGQINADVDPCVYSIEQSFYYYNQNAAGKLTSGELAQVPAQLVGDQTSCSFASGAVYDLTNNIQVLDTKAGKRIDSMLSVIVSWVTADALQAIEDIQNLFIRPGQEKLVKDLTKVQLVLSKDRILVLNYLHQADKILSTVLKRPILPVLKHLAGT